jgi:hypothetical protein
MNSHHSKHLKSCTKEYKEQVKHACKRQAGKTELLEVQYFFKEHTLFPPTLYTFFILHLSNRGNETLAL